MRKLPFVPCRTDARVTSNSSSRSGFFQLSGFRTSSEQIIELARQKLSICQLRRGLLALSIPALALSSVAFPAHESPQLPVVAVAADADESLDVRMSRVATPRFNGTIALGAPAANEETEGEPAGEPDVVEEPVQELLPSYDAAEIAMEHIGAPYRWGGSSPRGFDCSGLTRYVYRQLNIDLPHKASMQFDTRFGERIDHIDQLQPGDLVFFHRTTRARGITHVAMYVGDGMMVSANTPRTGVQHVSIHGTYWKTRFVGGIRPYR